MTEHRLPAYACPWCSEQLDAAANAIDDSSAPSEGDATICAYCGEWGVFNADRTLRKPTDAEFESFAADETCQNLRLAWIQVNLRKRQ